MAEIWEITQEHLTTGLGIQYNMEQGEIVGRFHLNGTET